MHKTYAATGLLLEQATRNMERLQRLQYTDLINYNSEYQRAEKAWDMVNLQMASLSAKCAAANNSYEQATKSLDASIKTVSN